MGTGLSHVLGASAIGLFVGEVEIEE